MFISYPEKTELLFNESELKVIKDLYDEMDDLSTSFSIIDNYRIRCKSVVSFSRDIQTAIGNICVRLDITPPRMILAVPEGCFDYHIQKNAFVAKKVKCWVCWLKK